jgi:hypothetical protein
MRPQPADQRYEYAYPFGAICAARGTGAALTLPTADTGHATASQGDAAPARASSCSEVTPVWHTTNALESRENNADIPASRAGRGLTLVVRQRTTAWIAGIGPLSIIRAITWRWPSSSLECRPRAFLSAKLRATLPQVYRRRRRSQIG